MLALAMPKRNSIWKKHTVIFGAAFAENGPTKSRSYTSATRSYFAIAVDKSGFHSQSQADVTLVLFYTPIPVLTYGVEAAVIDSNLYRRLSRV